MVQILINKLSTASYNLRNGNRTFKLNIKCVDYQGETISKQT